ncbi:hypothetical protein ACF0H5_022789 [Mactra antiquata]
MMDTSTPVNRGKKRGRPRKSDISLTPITSTSLNTEDDAATPQRLSKRQRKPTNFADFDLSDADSRVSSSKTKNRSKVNEVTKDKNIDAYNSISLDDSANVTSDDLSVSYDNLDNSNVGGAINSKDQDKPKGVKKRGRPKKIKTELAGTENVIETDDKKPRGRKDPLDVGDLFEIKIDIENDNECPKSPERMIASPRSMKIMKDAVESQRKIRLLEKKERDRNRPRKQLNVVDSVDDGSGNEEELPSLERKERSRGRPKTQASLVNAVDNDSENEEDISESKTEVEKSDDSKVDDSRVSNGESGEVSGIEEVNNKKNDSFSVNEEKDGELMDGCPEEHNDTHSDKRTENNVVAIDVASGNVNPNTHKTKGKKRGRPRKEDASNTDTSFNCSAIVFHADSLSDSRRGRGRPKKVESEVSEEIDEDFKPAGKRKRKKKGETEDDNENTEDNSGQIKCVHCDFECKTVLQIRKHSATVHQVWWESKSPQGLTNYAALVKVLGIRKYLNCPKCQKRLNFVQYFQKHVEWCGREFEMYTCEHCLKTLKSQWKEIHLRTCPALICIEKEEEMKKETSKEPDTSDGKSRKRKAAKKAMSMVHNLSKSADTLEDKDDGRDPDAVVADDDDDDDDDNDMDDVVEEGSDDNGDNDEDIDDVIEDDGIVGSGRNTSVYAVPGLAWPRVQPLCSYRLSKAYVNENWNTPVYEEWLPWKQDWKILNSSESKPYQIQDKSSPRFCFKKTDEPSCLKLYEGGIYNDSPLFYTGLCIWRTCWCPVPYNSKDVQYIAVTGKLQHTDLLIPDTKYIGPGVIQIWRTGITNNVITSSVIPKLCYTIAHDYGLPTEMKWCPSGCYRTNVDKENAAVYTRLGLLAASFTDGTLRIFSLPHPKCIESDVTLIYKPRPVITLLSCLNIDQQNVTCTAFDWCLTKGHTKVIAGYSNGSVKVYMLTNQSSFVKINTEKYGATLLPCQNLLPHGDVIRTVRWCSTSDHLFFTSSEKFETYFWDLNNLGIPIHCDEQCFMYVKANSKICLPGVFLTSEDSYTSQLNKSRYFEPGNMMYQSLNNARKMECQTFYTSAQAACIWDVDCSNWCSFVVACDNRGVILSSYIRDVMKHIAEQKCYKYRMELFRTHVIKDKISNNSKNNDSNASVIECAKCKNQSDSSVEGKCANDQSNSLLVCTCDKKHQSQCLSQNNPETSKTLTNQNTETSKCLTNQNPDNSIEDSDKIYYTSRYRDVIMNSIRTRDKEVENSILYFEENFKKSKNCRYDPLQDGYNYQSLAPIKSMQFNPNNGQCCWLCFGGDTGLVRLANIKNLLPRYDHMEVMKNDELVT